MQSEPKLRAARPPPKRAGQRAWLNWLLKLSLAITQAQ